MSNLFISTRFVIRKNKAKDGYAPIRLVYTINSQRAEVNTKLKCKVRLWEPSAQKVKGHSIEAKTLNAQLEKFKLTFFEMLATIQSSGDILTINDVKNYLNKKPEPSETLLNLCDQFIEEKRLLIGKSYAKATVKKYEYLRAKVVSFLEEKKKSSDLKMSTITRGFAFQFESYLKGKQQLGHNATTKYIQCLKSILNHAVELELIEKNPISTYKCSYEKTEIEVLSQDQIDKLVLKKFGNQRLEEVKDVFLFCCYSGYAYVDVSQLRPENIIKGIDGKQWIQTRRAKSNVIANVPLLPPAIHIIDKYKDHPYCLNKGVLLPVKSNQKMNEYLKEIGNICGINVKLTTHVARHTFATTILLNNGVALETVSKLLGHSKLSTTQIYAKLRDRKVADDMASLSANLFENQSSVNQKKIV